MSPDASLERPDTIAAQEAAYDFAAVAIAAGGTAVRQQGVVEDFNTVLDKKHVAYELVPKEKHEKTDEEKHDQEKRDQAHALGLIVNNLFDSDMFHQRFSSRIKLTIIDHILQRDEILSKVIGDTRTSEEKGDEHFELRLKTHMRRRAQRRS
jgi:hypothetical protein